MNKKWFAWLAIVCVLSQAFAGCAKTDAPDASGNESTGQVQTSFEQAETVPTVKKEVGTGIVIPGEDAVNAAGDAVSIASEGKLRIQYTGSRSNVVYVTSASDLPAYSALEQYDDEYFKEHALVLVTETVKSGSIDVGILSVNVANSIATVTLYHEAPEEGEYSTGDMATWLLWAEVETGLDCRWIVANPAMESDLSAY